MAVIKIIILTLLILKKTTAVSPQPECLLSLRFRPPTAAANDRNPHVQFMRYTRLSQRARKRTAPASANVRAASESDADAARADGGTRGVEEGEIDNARERYFTVYIILCVLRAHARLYYNIKSFAEITIVSCVVITAIRERK